MRMTADRRVHAYAHIVAADGHAALFARVDARALEALASALAEAGAIDALRIFHEALRICGPRAQRRRRLRADQHAALASLDRQLVRSILGEQRVA